MVQPVRLSYPLARTTKHYRVDAVCRTGSHRTSPESQDARPAARKQNHNPSCPTARHTDGYIQPQQPKSHLSLRNVLRAAPPILAGTCWFSMMSYFLIYYQTLKKDSEGHLPRIGPAYSTFPYISCVGAVQLSYFRGFASIVAFLVSLSFFLDFWIGRDVVPGRWFRRAKLFFGVISSVFLVLLSFESVNNGNHLHLIFTSIQIWCMGAAKLSDYFLSYRMRRHDRQNQYLLFAKKWKRAIGFVAAPASTVTLIGIYGCQMPVGLLPSSAKCYRMTSFSAPCEWVLALCWISYLYALGYDLYYAEAVAARIVSLASQGRGKHGKSASTEMRTFRAAKVFENDDDDISYRSQYSMPAKAKYASIKEQDMGV
ncbi:hypothetical protein EJ08DRAFT_521426 [Tothia fuscella]|uniref:CWH43-like N-terminal domain-containing protein n=1 Tax=Tothia fuscella TaxID=1048955 RepID=A0A9P4TSX4_9PEZI|nr:hypothetical protein EJ08DRAFT_521426 [Tothia fuscella]